MLDFVKDSERKHILNFEPGEGNRPLSAYKRTIQSIRNFSGQQQPENKEQQGRPERLIHHDEGYKFVRTL